MNWIAVAGVLFYIACQVYQYRQRRARAHLVAMDLRRAAPSTMYSLRCDLDVLAGWGSVVNVRQILPTSPGEPTRYTGDLDCIDESNEYRNDVVVAGNWPLDDCPERASRESVRATQIEIDIRCEAARIGARLARRNLIRLPSGAFLLLREQDILRSINLGADGSTLEVSTVHAVDHYSGDVHEDPPFAMDLYVVRSDRGPGGSVIADRVSRSIQSSRTPAPTSQARRVAHGLPIPIPGTTVGLQLRKVEFGSFSGSQWDSWEVALLQGPFQDPYEVEFGSRIISLGAPLSTNTADEEEDGNDIDPCSICLENFTVSDTPIARLRGCGHSFHGPCLRTWLTIPGMRRVCPMCSRPVLDGPSTTPIPILDWE